MGHSRKLRSHAKPKIKLRPLVLLSDLIQVPDRQREVNEASLRAAEDF